MLLDELQESRISSVECAEFALKIASMWHLSVDDNLGVRFFFQSEHPLANSASWNRTIFRVRIGNECLSGKVCRYNSFFNSFLDFLQFHVVLHVVADFSLDTDITAWTIQIARVVSVLLLLDLWLWISSVLCYCCGCCSSCCGSLSRLLLIPLLLLSLKAHVGMKKW